MTDISCDPKFELLQSKFEPFDDLQTAKSYIDGIKPLLTWERIGLFRNTSNQNLLILLIKQEKIYSIMRANLCEEEFLNLLDYISGSKAIIELRGIPDRTLTTEDIANIEAINSLWEKYNFATAILKNKTEKRKFIKDFYSNKKKIGRGKQFTSKTITKLMIDSHGRCMFTGCGENLDIDQLTGSKGNFAYNAHNIASSNNGERGLPFLSEILSDDPNNVLLLCDKHHRLIDKIAPSDYDSFILNNMRKTHKVMAQQLLDALAFEPIPVYSVLWPVHGQPASNPNLKEIASSLLPLRYRVNGCLIPLCDSTMDTELFNMQMIRHIEIEAGKIIHQTRTTHHKAAIFAFGPMPALIGLGALLGNKGEFIPMLKFRDSQKWEWPSQSKVEPFNQIIGLDKLKKKKEVVLCIHATAKVDLVLKKAQELANLFDNQIIEITTLPEYMGSKSIPHPLNVKELTAQIQKLLHKFKSDYGIERVHLFITAPNAACVAIGQGIDKNHPDIIVYDYKKTGLESVLRINSTEHGNKLLSV
ncbi:SAVED domain-containing protein [Acinetobacter sp. CWB-G5]|uniref:SAVED domain-containing protein n=1 Tax=Acinetobacter sp. CWB-G5 TaxID=2855444 RepID=UPI001C44E7B7|nr:SAVED domain-containing protein [Acinetobacter sp. CWB-G5]MBV7310199.1 SAVED domain-containing protein [Acinetobacter sp. CWB-G5]